MVHDNVLDLNLIRSPKNPDPDADQGIHKFTYSFLPHNGDLVNSEVIKASNILNQPPIMFDNVKSEVTMPISLTGDNLELSVLKKSEKDKELIIRVNETHGKYSSGILKVNGKIHECDMMEWNNINNKFNGKSQIKFELSPFEIRTFRIVDN